MELIEDSARAILYLGSCQNGNAIFGEEGGELRAALGVLKSGDSWSDWCTGLVQAVTIGIHSTDVPLP